METMQERMERIDKMAIAIAEWVEKTVGPYQLSIGQVDAALMLVIQRRALASENPEYIKVTAREMRVAADQLEGVLENWGRPVQ